MRKVFGLLTLVLALGVLASNGISPADAQDKAKTKKAKAGKEAGAGTVEIYKAKDGFRFRVKDGAGKTIAMPARGVETRDEIVEQIEEVKTILNKVKPTDAKD
jgi:hypothetical protein